MQEIKDTHPDWRATLRDPADLLPFSKEIILESDYVAPASHIYNDPGRAPL